MSVNAEIAAPCPPGQWVDYYTCACCGENYESFHPGISWDQGVTLVRSANDGAGGFRSRKPILWAMRVLKLTAWFGRHEMCGYVPADLMVDDVPF